MARTASPTVLKTGTLDVRGAAFAGRDAADDFGAVLDHLLRVERAFAAGQALHEELCFLVDQDAHRAPPARATTFSAPSFMSRAMVKFRPEARENFLALLDVGAFHAHDDGHFHVAIRARRRRRRWRGRRSAKCRRKY